MGRRPVMLRHAPLYRRGEITCPSTSAIILTGSVSKWSLRLDLHQQPSPYEGAALLIAPRSEGYKWTPKWYLQPLRRFCRPMPISFGIWAIEKWSGMWVMLPLRRVHSSECSYYTNPWKRWGRLSVTLRHPLFTKESLYFSSRWWLKSDSHRPLLLFREALRSLSYSAKTRIYHRKRVKDRKLLGVESNEERQSVLKRNTMRSDELLPTQGVAEIAPVSCVYIRAKWSLHKVSRLGLPIISRLLFF